MAYASRTGTKKNLDALRAAGWGLMVSARTPLWSAIGAAFGIGSTSSRNLCRAFGYDPDFYALAPLKRIGPS